ncbi:hypothetical protein [Mesorhizobium sp.]|uniref:hypothetical protein n=1 Tax=Mesorhizobium sp. TaxID=1871066 RepID=UPI0025FDBFA0|nr:hypothetical protein [Mesorhizobium sp.]
MIHRRAALSLIGGFGARCTGICIGLPTRADGTMALGSWRTEGRAAADWSRSR